MLLICKYFYGSWQYQLQALSINQTSCHNYKIACTIKVLRPLFTLHVQLFTVCARPGVRNRGQCQRAEKDRPTKHVFSDMLKTFAVYMETLKTT